MNKKIISRRNVLSALSWILAAPIFLFFYKFLSPKTEKEEVLIEISQEEIPEGGAVIFPDKNIALLKSENKVLAMSLVCTHLGCTISLSENKFVCPCHGSVFDIDGNVINGPADKPLKRYMTETEGILIRVYNEAQT